MNALVILLCGKTTKKEHVTMSGSITNKNSDSLLVVNTAGLQKYINMDDQGSFSDTLRLKAGNYVNLKKVQNLIQ